MSRRTGGQVNRAGYGRREGMAMHWLIEKILDRAADITKQSAGRRLDSAGYSREGGKPGHW